MSKFFIVSYWNCWKTNCITKIYNFQFLKDTVADDNYSILKLTYLTSAKSKIAYNKCVENWSKFNGFTNPIDNNIKLKNETIIATSLNN